MRPFRVLTVVVLAFLMFGGCSNKSNPATPAITAMNPDSTNNPVSGLAYDYFLGSWTSLPVFNTDSSILQGTVDTFDISPTFVQSNFGFVFSGYIEVPTDGLYTFYCSSDDGSKLFIGSRDSCIVSNDGVKNAAQEASGSLELKKGFHKIRVIYFCATGSSSLAVSWQGPGIPRQTIGASVLFHDLTSYTLQLLSPHGTHVWALGDTVRITWTYKNGPPTALYTNFDLSTDGGVSFLQPLFTLAIQTQPGDTGSVLWTIPNDTSFCTVHGLLRATQYDKPEVAALSDSEFTIAK